MDTDSPETTNDSNAVDADDPTIVVTGGGGSPLDLDRIEADLDGVQVALDRLDSGTYWTDEVTGAALPRELLAESPTTRHA